MVSKKLTYDIPEWGAIEVIGFADSAEVETWKSGDEMLAALRSHNCPWVHVKPDMPGAPVHVAVTFAGATIAFASRMFSTRQLVRFDDSPYWYLGWDTHAAGLDAAASTQVFERELVSPFYDFAQRSPREILVVAELDLMLIEPDGKEIWRTNVPDIIFNWELLPDALHLTLFDDVPMALDWATGEQIGDDAGRAPS